MKTRDISTTDSDVVTEEVQETKSIQSPSPSNTPRQRAPRVSKVAAPPKEAPKNSDSIPVIAIEQVVDRDTMPQERRDVQQPREDFNRRMPQSSSQSYNN